MRAEARRLKTILDAMERFEASASRRGTPAGSREEGNKFEHLAGEMWAWFALSLRRDVAGICNVRDGSYRSIVLYHSKGCIVLPRINITHLSEEARNEVEKITDIRNVKEPWKERAIKENKASFLVSDVLRNWINSGICEEISPESGPFSGSKYPEIFQNIRTRFDGAISIFQVDNHNVFLAEKILLEYKTAKASDEEKIDGNAHERLSFQIMQYLELATQFPKCSLAVFANGAFVKYKNKYHISFHAQSRRLSCFCWFEMDYLCTSMDYLRFLNKISAKVKSLG